MANASVALQSARVCLADPFALTWTDPILLPSLQEAYRTLVVALRVYSINVIKRQNVVLTVPIGTTILNGVTNFPTNLVNPISLMERDPGTDNESFMDMIETSFVPVIDQTTTLRFWAWMGEQIMLVGASSIREILLRYESTLTPPVTVNDPLNFIQAESYLGPKTAAISLNAVKGDGAKWDERAEAALYELIKVNIKDDQRPARRRAYRSGGASYVSVPNRTV